MTFKHQVTLSKILTYLKGSGWEHAMQSYWKSDNFKEVITQLHQFVEDEKRFVPKVKDMFKWMSVCPWEDIKCVIFIDDTRNHIGIPGIPYSQDIKKMTRVKLGKFHQTEDTRCNKNEDIEQFVQRVKRGKEDDFDYDLTHWCKQGVLMVPYRVTSRIGIISKVHSDLWKEFRARLIEEISYTYPDIPWVLVNLATFAYRPLIDSKHILNVKAEHPYQNNHWPFWINSVLKEQGKSPVIWNREDKYPFKEENTVLKHINFGYSILNGYF